MIQSSPVFYRCGNRHQRKYKNFTQGYTISNSTVWNEIQISLLAPYWLKILPLTFGSVVTLLPLCHMVETRAT